MTTKTVTIGKDGTLIITKSDEGGAPGTETGAPLVIHPDHHRSGLDAGSFIAGLITGIVLLLLVQRRKRVKALSADAGERESRRTGSEFDALARRTATLERIVTDPAQRVAADIDALR